MEQDDLLHLQPAADLNCTSGHSCFVLFGKYEGKKQLESP